MKFLAIDTVFNKCAVAIIETVDENTSTSCQTLIHLEKEGERQQTQQILPMIEEALEKANIKLSELSALIFNRGPGAFSGIRINTAVIQALSVGCDIPCVGISSLQLLAQSGYENNNQLFNSTDKQSVYSIIDARMKQVYIGKYVCIDNIMQLSSDTEEKLLDYDKSTDENLTIFSLKTDDKNLIKPLGNQNLIDNIETNAITLAKLGADKFLKTGGVSAEKALPVYIRHNAWKTIEEQGKKS